MRVSRLVFPLLSMTTACAAHVPSERPSTLVAVSQRTHVGYCGLTVLSREIAGSDIEVEAGTPGTTVMLLASTDSGRLVGFSGQPSAISVFEDSRGRTLLSSDSLKTKSAGSIYHRLYSASNMFTPGFGTLPRRSLLMIYSVPVSPSAGSTVLHLAGVIRLAVAAGVDSVRLTDLSSSGTQIGPLADSISITHVGVASAASPDSKIPFAIRIRIAGPFAAQVSEVDMAVGGKYTQKNVIPTASRSTVDVESRMPSDPKTFTLEFELLHELRDVEVPIDFRVGLGSQSVCTPSSANGL
jgi:hypothetical protein